MTPAELAWVLLSPAQRKLARLVLPCWMQASPAGYLAALAEWSRRNA